MLHQAMWGDEEFFDELKKASYICNSPETKRIELLTTEFYREMTEEQK